MNSSKKFENAKDIIENKQTELVKKFNLNTDFKRPNKLSDNHTGLLDVIIYVLDEYKKRNYFFVL